MPPEERAKRGRKGELNPFYGKRHTDETKAKIGAANRGRRCPWKGKSVPESTWRCRLKKYIVTAPDGEEFIVEHLGAFCKERGLTRSVMVSVANERWMHHKGWKCRHAPNEPPFDE